MRIGFSTIPLLLVPSVASQQIWDIWQTTWDRSRLFTSLAPTSPINFGAPSTIGSADIVVQDSNVYQTIAGFGGSLTDSSALLLSNLKSKNSGNYWALLNTLFNAADGANAAGLSYIRVPLGASDFAARAYTFADTPGDTSFNSFNLDAAPWYLYTVLQDIYSINSGIKVHLIPWSPPGWMKDSGTMYGGSLKSNLITTYASYLLKCLQGFRNRGFPLYAISIQNEPQHSNPTYPTTVFTPTTEAQVGIELRRLMDSNGFQSVKLLGYDHNWDNAGSYAVQLMQNAPNAFAGVSFHCYGGSVGNQDTFRSQWPNKEIYFTECSGTMGSDWWSDLKWYMDNIFIGSVQHYSMSGLMWNIALDGNGNPKLPGTDSCGGPGCRGIVQVNSDGSYSVNQEFYAMAQASKAIIPKDAGGPTGKRIGTTVGGSLGWGLRVNGFVTERTSSSEWLRYSLVVLNWNDRPDGSWNPTPIQTTIEFRGMQATYTFPVGVTTLWWYAPRQSFNGTTVDEQVPLGVLSDDIEVKHTQRVFSWSSLLHKFAGHLGKR